MEDVVLHVESPSVGTGDVEVVLTENHAQLRLQRAEGGKPV